MARIEKEGGRKPVAQGNGPVWVNDDVIWERSTQGYLHVTGMEYRLSFSGDDGKTYQLVITEQDSFEVVRSLTSYHADKFRREQKRKDDASKAGKP